MSDCIIIGSGIIGMLTARNLQMAGAEVTLIEKSQPGQESSWAGGGIVSPLYPWRYDGSVTRLASWGQRHYPLLCEQLKEDSGIDPEYVRSGLMIIAPDEQQQALSWSEHSGPGLEIIPADDIRTIEPAMSTTAESAIWMESVAQIRNPRIAKSLRVDVEKRGIRIISNTEIVSFYAKNEQIIGVTDGYETFHADQYAVCSGAWSGTLLAQLGTDIPVRPVQGQMILFRAKPHQVSRMVLEQDRYIIPRRDGRILFGSTIEHVDFNKHTTDAARQELHDIAVSRFPLLRDCEIEHHWAGLRPGSPQGIPIISRHPSYKNLFVNAGHFRNGVVLAPASCRLMVELMQGHHPFLPTEPYSL
ncbi:MAG: glycine oxidase ThiO [Chromatiales bacterium]|jgi:glycine oxidase